MKNVVEVNLGAPTHTPNNIMLNSTRILQSTRILTRKYNGNSVVTIQRTYCAQKAPSEAKARAADLASTAATYTSLRTAAFASDSTTAGNVQEAVVPVTPLGTVPPPPSTNPYLPLRTSTQRACPHFDTFDLVKRLQSEGGFTEQQAVALTASFDRLLAETFDKAIEQTASQSEHDQLAYRYKTDMSQLRQEQTTLEKSIIDSLNSNRKELVAQFDKLSDKVKEDIRRVKSDLSLDLSLEKGRVSQLLDQHKNEIWKHSQTLEREKTTFDSKLTEIKLEMLRWSLGAIGTVAALIIGWLRFSDMFSKKKGE